MNAVRHARRSGRPDGSHGRRVSNKGPLPAICFLRGRVRWLQSPVIVVRPRSDVTDLPTWMCLICGWIYDEAAGDPEHGLAPGTAWADVPLNWVCPECGARKEDFEMVQI